MSSGSPMNLAIIFLSMRPWELACPTRDRGARPARFCSGKQRAQLRMTLDQRKLLDPSVKAPDVARPLGDQVAEHAGIDDMEIEEEVVLVLDVREVHVCHPVHQHQHDAEPRADTDHESEDQ